jgi:hypothetical protein
LVVIAGMSSMQSRMAGVVAIFVAMPLLSCSMNLKWDSDPPPEKPPQAASQAASQVSSQASQDDATVCQSAGYMPATPEYQQCLQSLAQQRANAERAERRPFHVAPR